MISQDSKRPLNYSRFACPDPLFKRFHRCLIMPSFCSMNVSPVQFCRIKRYERLTNSIDT